jgi:hypothetical protein
MRSEFCLCDCVSPHISFRIALSIFMKLGMYIMEPEPISTACLVNPPYQCVCLYVYPFIVGRQRIGNNFTEATKTHATTEELLDKSCSIWSVSYQET